MPEILVDEGLLGFLENVFKVSNDEVSGSKAIGMLSSPTHQFQVSTHYLKVYHIGELALIRQVIISYNADEALAFLSSNRLRFPDIGTVAVVAIGLKPGLHHARMLKKIFPVTKWYLIFSADIMGNCADIIIAAGFHQLPVAIHLNDDSIVWIRFLANEYLFPADTLTLNTFEKAVKRRFGIRTDKLRNLLAK